MLEQGSGKEIIPETKVIETVPAKDAIIVGMSTVPTKDDAINTSCISGDPTRSIAQHKNLPSTAFLGDMDDKKNIPQTQQNTSESHITDVETAFLKGILENT